MVSLLLIGLEGSADAQPPACEAELRTLRAVTPADGAQEVTLDAPLRFDYALGTLGSLSEAETGVRVSRQGEPEALEGETRVLGDSLFWRAKVPWAPGSAYEGEAQATEASLRFRFTTAADVDRAPPELGPIRRADWTEAEAGCGVPAGSLRVVLSFVAARDDGPSSSIEYLVHLSRAQGLGAPELLARQRDTAAEEATIAFVLPPSRAARPVCVVLSAVDGVGKTSTSAPWCFDPVRGEAFASLCSLRPGKAAPSASLLELGLLLLLSLSLGRRLERRRKADIKAPHGPL